MKSSISAKIPTELYEEVQAAIKTEKYTSNTECIIEGLNLLLCNPDQEDTTIKTLLQEKEKEIQILQEEVNRSKEEIQALQEEVKRSKDEVSRSKEDYTRQIKNLEENLKKAPDLVEFAQLRTRSEELEKHNQDLKGKMEKQLEFLKGQIVIKDQQIEKQAFSLQSVIQENGRLNLRLLPEAQETKNTQEQKFTRWQYLKGFLFGSQ
ncbi:hypothetical protein [Methanosarcina sp. UBA5]|uniref:hypothetical protein n=1 Tax=Methanosarcina sp. UBA5 TaxID=1915593 RepID=UPI0025FFE6EA|nr:hypothetical protein [Methanosarcina sp. UBA5]